MSPQRPRQSHEAVVPARPGILGESEPAAAALGEVLRRVALALTAGLIVARMYWPAEYRSEGDSGNGLFWTMALLAVALVAALGIWLQGGPRPRPGWADFGVLGLFGLVAASASHAADRRVAINLAWEWVGVGVSYLLLRSLPRRRAETTALAAALIVTSVALSAYGLVQVGIEHPRLRADYRANPRAMLAQMGVDPDLAPEDPERRRLEDRLLGSREPVATYALANTFAGVLVGPAATILSLAVLGLTAARRRPSWTVFLAAIPCTILLVAFLLTKSRSAYLGLTLATVIQIWRCRRRLGATRLIVGAILATGLLGLLIVAGALAGQLDRQILTEGFKSLTYRLEYWRGAWGVIRDTPGAWWMGLGPGNFAGPYLGHKLVASSEEIADPHNVFLEVWATAGLPAMIAMILALGTGLAALLHREEAPSGDSPSEAASLTLDRWILTSAGLGGWVLVVALGRLNPFEQDLMSRWMILGLGWLVAAILLLPASRHVPWSAGSLGLGMVAILVNLLAAGGIGFAPVMLMLWGMLALGLNLRREPERGASRFDGGREAAFLMAASAAAGLGMLVGTSSPFWNARSAIEAADAALTGVIADPVEADRLYRDAAEADRFGSEARIKRANLEYREWRRRGRPAEDLAWHRIDSGLKSAMEPPRNPDNLLVHRLRTRFAREFLDLPNLLPAERHRIQSDRLDSAIAACNLYPTDASLRADLAEAYAEMDRFREAAEEAREALSLDSATPHLDKKLRRSQRDRLRASLPRWENP